MTGPTGSGKTTTLYSALAEINDPGVNISTAEDPIEYDLPGVTQIQVQQRHRPRRSPAILRAFLRQDPDVLLVGETRDKETAHTAVEAALTGHLVFTTLHTNSAAAAFTRLERDGHRAVPGVVVHHRRHRAAAGAAAVPGLQGAVRGRTRRPRGSSACRRARRSIAGAAATRAAARACAGAIGIYEVMRMTPALRQMVGKGAAPRRFTPRPWPAA